MNNQGRVQYSPPFHASLIPPLTPYLANQNTEKLPALLLAIRQLLILHCNGLTRFTLHYTHRPAFEGSMTLILPHLRSLVHPLLRSLNHSRLRSPRTPTIALSFKLASCCKASYPKVCGVRILIGGTTRSSWLRSSWTAPLLVRLRRLLQLYAKQALIPIFYRTPKPASGAASLIYYYY